MIKQRILCGKKHAESKLSLTDIVKKVYATFPSMVLKSTITYVGLIYLFIEDMHMNYVFDMKAPGAPQTACNGASGY